MLKSVGKWEKFKKYYLQKSSQRHSGAVWWLVKESWYFFLLVCGWKYKIIFSNINLPERSPPNGVELIPPRPREGAAVVVDITLVVSPVNVFETEPDPKPKKNVSRTLNKKS